MCNEPQLSWIGFSTEYIECIPAGNGDCVEYTAQNDDNVLCCLHPPYEEHTQAGQQHTRCYGESKILYYSKLVNFLCVV